jgi:hypothetical protein
MNTTTPIQTPRLTIDDDSVRMLKSGTDGNGFAQDMTKGVKFNVFSKTNEKISKKNINITQRNKSKNKRDKQNESINSQKMKAKSSCFSLKRPKSTNLASVSLSPDTTTKSTTVTTQTYITQSTSNLSCSTLPVDLNSSSTSNNKIYSRVLRLMRHFTRSSADENEKQKLVLFAFILFLFWFSILDFIY